MTTSITAWTSENIIHPWLIHSPQYKIGGGGELDLRTVSPWGGHLPPMLTAGIHHMYSPGAMVHTQRLGTCSERKKIPHRTTTELGYSSSNKSNRSFSRRKKLIARVKGRKELRVEWLCVVSCFSGFEGERDRVAVDGLAFEFSGAVQVVDLVQLACPLENKFCNFWAASCIDFHIPHRDGGEACKRIGRSWIIHPFDGFYLYYCFLKTCPLTPTKPKAADTCVCISLITEAMKHSKEGLFHTKLWYGRERQGYSKLPLGWTGGVQTDTLLTIAHP